MTGARGLKRAVGGAGPATLALALLVCGCVFAAMAGPALSLHARSQALQQTLAKLAPTVKTVQISAGLSNFLGIENFGSSAWHSGPPTAILAVAALAAEARTLGRRGIAGILRAN